MKRNKRTVVVAQENVTPLTEQILQQMGPDGSSIRRRLQRFYRERAGSRFFSPESRQEKGR